VNKTELKARCDQLQIERNQLADLCRIQQQRMEALDAEVRQWRTLVNQDPKKPFA
jgi:hypothetical protein